MSHLFFILLVVLLGATVLPLASARYRSGVSHEIADATNIFSINLIKEVFDKDPGNIIISPVSLSTLLAMVHQAAASDTRKQLTQLLHAGPQTLRTGYSKIILNIKNPEDNATLEFANGAFLSQDVKVKDQFRRVLSSDFLSEVQTVDFSQPEKAANTINSWIEEHTHGRIKNLIKSEKLSADNRLVLTNAIYFKSLWKTPFVEKLTKYEPFYKLDGTQVEVPTMHLNALLKSGGIENLDSEWIEFPFEGKRYSMLIVLPSAGHGAFEELMRKFNAQHLTTIMDSIKTAYEDFVLISFPKFKISTEINYIPILQLLGLTDIFNLKSNLPGITGQTLSVNQVVQKAEIEVDEKGATASAATGIGAIPVSSPLQFKINHPFLMFIIDNINSIPLFAGKITDPSVL